MALALCPGKRQRLSESDKIGTLMCLTERPVVAIRGSWSTNWGKLGFRFSGMRLIGPHNGLNVHAVRLQLS